jgi:hypothetical protein
VLVAAKPDGIKTDTIPVRTPADPMMDRGPRPPQATPPWRLLLQIGGENRTTLGVTVVEWMLVGRSTDPDDDLPPEINLAPYDALRNGVSRRHALIKYEDGALYLEDLDSTNGTRINGYQLKAGRGYRLRDGDELEFGRLRAVIRFVRSS